MYIRLENSELGNFPSDVYTFSEDPLVEPTLVSEAPYKFKLISQEVDNKTYEVFGEVYGDTELFVSEALVDYIDSPDVPEGFDQRLLAGSVYGTKLNLAEIKSALKKDARLNLTCGVTLSSVAPVLTVDNIPTGEVHAIGTVLTFNADLEAKANLTGAVAASSKLGLTESPWTLANNQKVLLQLADIEMAQALAVVAFSTTTGEIT
jgi:hypothetical protein